MEWGTFLTVVSALYLAYYGINFLYDMFVGGKPQVVSNAGIQYTVSELVDQQEQAQVISEKDFDDATVMVHHDPDPADSPVPAGPLTWNPGAEMPSSADAAAEDLFPEIRQAPSDDPSVPGGDPAPDPASSMPEPFNQTQADESEESEKIEMQVQGQPMTVSDFLKSFKIEAKSEAQSIFG